MLRQNDIHAGSWWISSPTYLFGNVNDDNVPYGNHTSFLDHMAFRTTTPGVLTEQSNEILTLSELESHLSRVTPAPHMGFFESDRLGGFLFISK